MVSHGKPIKISWSTASKPPTGKTGKRGVWVSEKCWLPPLSLHFAASITMNIPSSGWSEPLRAPQAPLWPAQTHANAATASMVWPVPKIWPWITNQNRVFTWALYSVFPCIPQIAEQSYWENEEKGTKSSILLLFPENLPMYFPYCGTQWIWGYLSDKPTSRTLL